MSENDVAKYMTRNLTPVEEGRIYAYMKSNPDMYVQDVIEHFEQELNTPVTRACIDRIMNDGLAGVNRDKVFNSGFEKKQPEKPKGDVFSSGIVQQDTRPWPSAPMVDNRPMRGDKLTKKDVIATVEAIKGNAQLLIERAEGLVEEMKETRMKRDLLEQVDEEIGSVDDNIAEALEALEQVSLEDYDEDEDDY